MNPHQQYHHQQALNSLSLAGQYPGDNIGRAPVASSLSPRRITRSHANLDDDNHDHPESVTSRFSVCSEDDDRTAYSSRASRFSPRRWTRALRQSFVSWDRGKLAIGDAATRVGERKRVTTNVQITLAQSRSKTRAWSSAWKEVSVRVRASIARSMKISWFHSGQAIVCSSWISIFLVFLPFAWATHFGRDRAGIPLSAVFSLCFVSVIPLNKLIEYGAWQLSTYCSHRKWLGQLIQVSLSNSLVVALSISLLVFHELRLLQSTIIGITVLRLLVVPGLSLLVAPVPSTRRTHEHKHARHPHLQHGDPYHDHDLPRDGQDNEDQQVHQNLLAIALLALVLPALFFAGLDKREIGLTTNISTRDQLVSISQGLAVVLLSTYICAILFFHPTLEDRSAPSLPPAPSSPPISMPLASTSHAQHNLLSQSPQPVTKEHEQNQNQPIVSSQSHTQQGPQINIAACILLIFVALSSMCITTYFLVSAVHAMHASTSSPLSGVQIRAELLALIILPVTSIAGDLLLYSCYFLQCIASALSSKFTSTTTTDINTNTTTTTTTFPSSHPTPPISPSSRLALQITTQFLLFWVPCFLFICSIISLATPQGGTPLSMLLLLFDVFEVGILMGAWLLASWCYRAGEDRGDGYGEGSYESDRIKGVDARREARKTKVKRARGALLIIFYIMITITAWSYPGQPDISHLLLSTTTSDNPGTREGGTPTVFASTLEPQSVVQTTNLPLMTPTVPPPVPIQGTGMGHEGDDSIQDDDDDDDSDEFENEYIIGEDSEFDDRLVDILRLLVHVV
ncbi:hypothetical protein AB1N83_002926 [Pleurotus pulmonarius]